MADAYDFVINANNQCSWKCVCENVCEKDYPGNKLIKNKE